MDSIIINNEILERAMLLFAKHIETLSNGRPFDSFLSNPYMRDHEGYKFKVFEKQYARILSAHWQESDIGTGKIAETMIRVVQNNSNLVGPYQTMHFKNKTTNQLQDAELVLYNLYCSSNDESAFNEAVNFFGAKYDLIGYLMFIKDASKYLPIRPTVFDGVFAQLGINLKTTANCSWQNYLSFIHVVNTIKDALASYFAIEVRLIDAHSFLWQLARIDAIDFTPVFDASTPRQKDTMRAVSSRLGQHEYRKSLLALWKNSCSVTSCANQDLLVASHIKPWRECTENNEWLNPYNGLMLIPNLDRAFDQGLISFSDTGSILISPKLTVSDCEKLGISKSMALRFVLPEHIPFLQYHRQKYSFSD